MPNDDPKDPLEGKGEEMIPDRGLPFDDIVESTPEEASASEEEIQDSPEEPEAIPEEAAPPENLEAETPPEEEFSESEAILDEAPNPEEDEAWETGAQPALFDEAELSAEAAPEGETEIPLGLPPEEDLPPGGASEIFTEVPHPWEMSEDEVETFIGDAEASFAPSPELEASLIGEQPSPFLGEEEYSPPPADLPDEGMGTALEESSYMGEVPSEEMAIPQPASMSGAPLFSEAAFIEPGPTASIESGKTPAQDAERVAREEMIRLLISDEAIRALWKRADVAQGQVLKDVNTLPIGRQMLDHIQAARNELLGGRENYEEAERFVNEVAYRVSLSQRLSQWSKGYVALLYLYEIVWAIILILTLILYLGENAFAGSQAAGTSIMTYLIGSMIWGGFGGVIGAWLSLVKHIAVEQDFDKQHTWWYINSPPVGVAMGAFIFLIMQGGLLSITGSVNSITSPIVIYILAGLAGYQQNVFTDLIRRLLKVFAIEEKKEEEEITPIIQTSKPAEKEPATENAEEIEEIPG